MSTIGQPERATQNRVIALFRDELDYRYLGDWTAGPDNSKKGYSLLRYGVPVKIEAGKVTPPVAPPVTPPLEVLVRLLGQTGALGNAEMSKHLGLKDRTHLREQYLDPALSGLPVLHGPRGVSPVCGQRDPRPGCTVRTRLV